MDDNTTDDLVRRSRSGDATAFDALVGLHYVSTYRFSYKILGKKEAAEDATQETFFEAWRTLRKFRGDGSFQAWILSIASSHCFNAARKPGYHDVALEEWESLTVGLSAESDFGCDITPSSLADWDREIAIRDLVEHLPDPPRTVLTLFYFGDQTIREIALTLKMSERTTRNNLYQGLSRLKRIFQVKETP